MRKLPTQVPPRHSPLEPPHHIEFNHHSSLLHPSHSNHHTTSNSTTTRRSPPVSLIPKNKKPQSTHQAPPLPLAPQHNPPRTSPSSKLRLQIQRRLQDSCHRLNYILRSTLRNFRPIILRKIEIVRQNNLILTKFSQNRRKIRASATRAKSVMLRCMLR